MIRGVIALLAAYILGSFPSAYYAGIWLKGVDLRKVGSGNLGFTNAYRTLGLRWSLPVLLIDIGKGILAVCVCRWLVPGNEWLAIACGLAAILGHNWTLFLGFKGGGKGVAVSAGVFAALTLVPFLIAFTVFFIMIWISRYVSLGSLSGAVTLVTSEAILRAMENPYAPTLPVFLFSIVAALLVIVRHRTNIRQLLNGTELKFEQTEKRKS